MMNKRECQKGVSSRLKGSDVETTRSKGCAVLGLCCFSHFEAVGQVLASDSFASAVLDGIAFQFSLVGQLEVHLTCKTSFSNNF